MTYGVPESQLDGEYDPIEEFAALHVVVILEPLEMYDERFW